MIEQNKIEVDEVRMIDGVAYRVSGILEKQEIQEADVEGTVAFIEEEAVKRDKKNKDVLAEAKVEYAKAKK